MDVEFAIVLAAIALAAAFVGWRVWSTLRIASGKKSCGGCGCAETTVAD